TVPRPRSAHTSVPLTSTSVTVPSPTSSVSGPNAAGTTRRGARAVPSGARGRNGVLAIPAGYGRPRLTAQEAPANVDNGRPVRPGRESPEPPDSLTRAHAAAALTQ